MMGGQVPGKHLPGDNHSAQMLCRESLVSTPDLLDSSPWTTTVEHKRMELFGNIGHPSCDMGKASGQGQALWGL